MNSNTPLNNDVLTIIYQSSDPKNIFCYSPGITILDDLLLVTMDIGGPGVINIKGPKNSRAENTRFGMGKIYISNDCGATWQHRLDFPFWHARPFVVNKTLYVLGHAGDLMIIKSEDKGLTWTDPVYLTEGDKWHAAPCNVHYSNGYIYLAMDKRERLDVEGWNVSGLSPILLRAKIGDDLLDKTSWIFSNPIVFREVVDSKNLENFGIPFFSTPEKSPAKFADNRFCSPIGWLEPNVIQFKDPNHYFYGENTFHLFLRTHTGGTGYAAIVKVIEKQNILKACLETVPSGKKIIYTPFPGGHLKFHILYDDISELYWLICNQATDSMTKLENLPSTRFNMPNNERHRLQLYFSKNCIDWCFAKILASGKEEKFSRNYASMVINKKNLNYVCRSGDTNALDPQYTNLITFHTVKDFRSLVY